MTIQLIKAVINGQTDVARRLLDQGAYVNHRAVFGSMALQLAARKDYEDIVRVLQGAGAAD